AGLAVLEAHQGRDERCRAHAEEARAMSQQLNVATHGVWTIQALGDLELAAGRPEAALAHYEEQLRALEEHEIADVDMSPVPEMVEAHVRLGQPQAAAGLAARFAADADEKGQPWARARARRALGLLADEEHLDECFEAALLLHDQTPDAFELARTRLAYGARL